MLARTRHQDDEGLAALTASRVLGTSPVRMHSDPSAPPAHGAPSPAAGLVATYRRHRFTALFVTLLFTLGTGSTLEALLPNRNPLQVLLALNLIAAIASVAHEGRMRLPIAIGLAFLVTRFLLAVLGMPAMLAVSDGVWVIGIVLATAASVRHAFGRGVVDRERIMAALDAYILVGLLFGVAYWMLDRFWPGSLGGAVKAPLDLLESIYFSFVTIATLGYGDVVPASAPARGLAVVEGVSGQMYLAVLVARLVSLYAQEREA